MDTGEIVLPHTQPETEWLAGRARQKVSPQRDHAQLQRALLVRLDPWARGRGELGPEWRFRVMPPGGPIRPLVPDISFVRRERLADLTDAEIQMPLLAPDVAFEILSPDDRRNEIDEKVAVLLSAGSALVVVVDPALRRVVLHDRARVSILAEGDSIEHPALDGFRYAVTELFGELRRDRERL